MGISAYAVNVKCSQPKKCNHSSGHCWCILALTLSIPTACEPWPGKRKAIGVSGTAAVSGMLLLLVSGVLPVMAGLLLLAAAALRLLRSALAFFCSASSFWRRSSSEAKSFKVSSIEKIGASYVNGHGFLKCQAQIQA